MVARTASLNEEDIWHVQVSDGDIRVVTVDQLDDLFRLDLIDESVNVWQPGMPTWQPLKVVAGMDEQSLKQVPPVSRPPPAPPKRATQPEPISVAPWAAPNFALSSFGPAVTSDIPNPYQSRSSGGGFGRVVLGLLAVAGISITAYRNGLVQDAARAAHQDALYHRAEAALGPPGFGTLSSVDRMTSVAMITLPPGLSGPSSAAEAKPSSPTPAKAAEPSAPSTPVVAAPVQATNAAAPVAATTPAAAAPSATPAKAVSLDALPREGSAAPKPMAAAPAPASKSTPAKPGGKGLSSGLKGSSSAYDPLNGKL
ncbi:MAG TPA: hypothetical protein VGM29_18760 [Polyangiaceae bacterium]|jgi:hypothetical protein